MKRKLFASSTVLLSLTLVCGLAACGGGEKAPPDVPPPPAAAQNGVTLSAANSVNTATARFTAAYTEEGIVLDAEVSDTDIYADVYYSYGYDDNVEYLINLTSEAEGWDTEYTYHFLITADGDTFFQRAVTGNSFGPSYSLDLLASYGENFEYSAELTENGYRTHVFLAYSLLNTNYEEGYENLCVCPAMRNTHDYADTVWAAYSGSGCDWNRASTFLKIDAKGYVDGAGEETEVLFIGDELLTTSNWLTYYDDTSLFGAVNLGMPGGTAAYWQAHLSEITAYAPEKMVVLFGTGASSAQETTDFLLKAHALLPDTTVYFTECLAFAGTDAAQVKACNDSVRAFCGENAYAVWVLLGFAENGLGGLVTASGRGFNQFGYNLWMKAVREAADLPCGTSASFGDGALFASSPAIGEEDGNVHLDGRHDQYTYFKGSGAAEFYAEASLTAVKIYNGDAYPKFGLVISSREKTLFFYIDGSGSLTTQRVGYVYYDGNHSWNWEGSVEQSVAIAYTGEGKCKLALLKYGGYLFLMADGEAVFTIEDPFGAVPVDTGVLSFNTHILLSAPRYATADLSDYLPV